MLGCFLAHLDDTENLADDVQTHQEQVHRNERLDDVGIDRRDRPGTQRGTQHPWNQQTQEQAAVHIAQLHVRDTRHAGGEHFGNVHTGTRHRRGRARRHQETARRDAVRHAQRTIHGLGQQAHGHCFPENVALQGLGDQLPPCRVMRAIEQAGRQKRHHRRQQERHRPHRHAQHGVPRRVRDVIFDRRQTQRLVLGVDRVVAQVKVADLHEAGSNG